MYLHSVNCADNTPSDRYFDELCVVLHAYCRDEYTKYINGNQGAVKSILRLPDGNKPEDLNVFNSITCKNNVVLDYLAVWQRYTFSFAHG